MSGDSQLARRGHSFRAKSLIERSLRASVSLILLAVTLGALAAAQGAASPRAELPEEITPYLNPQRLVPIARGRTINLVCLGQGSPTVVL